MKTEYVVPWKATVRGQRRLEGEARDRSSRLHKEAAIAKAAPAEGGVVAVGPSEEWVERAAIIEYCGNVPRAEAERLATAQVRART